MVDYSTVYGFLLSLGIGALVGIERQKTLSNEIGVAGARTFILISLLGTSLAMLAEYSSIVLSSVFAIGLIVLICLGYYRSSVDKGSVGLTTEISE
ncbi:MAG: MgtC/SapB family protein, partial [Candidatus Altiarchaeales archaeon]|nr:MgtC/SapB family protein [Candidatus Altiarchaeales archaeon]